MPPRRTLNENIQRHYANSDLGSAILDALTSAGKDIDDLQPEDLASIDEFHTRGRQATIELARAVGLDETTQVLDVGCGIGGPSRCIAREFGCRVTGIDLTEEYCDVAAMLAQRSKLSHLVKYRQGDALDLPYPDGTFDVVWTQHAAMNIPDKATLYREMHRVLKSGGMLALYDILAGPVSPVFFPVPWASVPETSFLITPDDLRGRLEASGFEITSWEDPTQEATEWFARLARKIQQSGMPPLSSQLFLGPAFPTMAQNLRRNLQEGRVVLAQVLARK